MPGGGLLTSDHPVVLPSYLSTLAEWGMVTGIVESNPDSAISITPPLKSNSISITGILKSLLLDSVSEIKGRITSSISVPGIKSQVAGFIATDLIVFLVPLSIPSFDQTE